MNAMIILFGATGDLAKRKLIPSLYKLYDKDMIQKIPILCIGRKQLSQKQFIDEIELNTFIPKAKEGTLKKLVSALHYQAIDFKETHQEALKKTIKRLDAQYNCKGNKVFYFAMPASVFDPIIKLLKENNILGGRGYNRVVFEKPFGYDLKSAKKLNKCIRKVFTEDQVYRIDHYLGKDLVENILVMRFGNTIFEQVWNNKFIDHVQITIAEEVGVEERAGYYDTSGATRDMIQNHIMQMLALTAMEPPKKLEANAIRDEKVKVLKKTRAKKSVAAQYQSGMMGKQKVPGYLSEEGIAKGSQTETYAAVKFAIDTKRWKGVPFFVRTGKRLAGRIAEVNLVFKDVASKIFKHEADLHKNTITIRIQPDDGIGVQFNTKKPGHKIHLASAKLDYCYHCQFALNTTEAYESLLYQILLGDQKSFSRWDEVEQSWKIVDPLVKAALKKLTYYRAGTSGPKAAKELIAPRYWCLSNDCW